MCLQGEEVIPKGNIQSLWLTETVMVLPIRAGCHQTNLTTVITGLRVGGSVCVCEREEGGRRYACKEVAVVFVCKMNINRQTMFNEIKYPCCCLILTGEEENWLCAFCLHATF